jgi:hypothetical protein
MLGVGDPPMKGKMKTNMLVATSLLLSLGLSVASAGQPDSRFYGIWVGVETYEIPTHAGPTHGSGFGQQGEPPVKKAAVIEIAGSGQTLTFGQGLLQGRVEISPWWGENTLDFRVRGRTSLRTHGRLVLSADGNTLTETAFGRLPSNVSSTVYSLMLTCNISGTFHRQGKK